MRQALVLIALLASGCVSNRVQVEAYADQSVEAFKDFVRCSDTFLRDYASHPVSNTELMDMAQQNCRSFQIDYEAAMTKMFIQSGQPYAKASILAKIDVDEMTTEYRNKRLSELASARKTKRQPSTI